MTVYLKCIFYISSPKTLYLSGNELCLASHLTKVDRNPYNIHVFAAFQKPGQKKRATFYKI